MEVYTVNELAKMLKVATQTVYRLLESGELKGVKVGRVWRVRREDLEEYLRR